MPISPGMPPVLWRITGSDEDEVCALSCEHAASGPQAKPASTARREKSTFTDSAFQEAGKHVDIFVLSLEMRPMPAIGAGMELRIRNIFRRARRVFRRRVVLVAPHHQRLLLDVLQTLGRE